MLKHRKGHDEEAGTGQQEAGASDVEPDCIDQIYNGWLVLFDATCKAISEREIPCLTSTVQSWGYERGKRKKRQ